jgi:hypothetical protein
MCIADWKSLKSFLPVRIFHFLFSSFQYPFSWRGKLAATILSRRVYIILARAYNQKKQSL